MINDTEHQLRTRLISITRGNSYEVTGSLYLRALGCVWLATDIKDLNGDRSLETLFYAQAGREDVDADKLVTELTMIVAPTGAQS